METFADVLGNRVRARMCFAKNQWHSPVSLEFYISSVLTCGNVGSWNILFSNISAIVSPLTCSYIMMLLVF